MVMHLRTSSNLRSRLKIFSFPSIAFLHAKMRFRISDVPSNVSKGSPDFCTVYVIHKGKISSVRNASRSSPFNSPLLAQIQKQTDNCSFQFAEPSRHSFQFAARSGHSFQGHARHRSLSMKGAEMMRQMPRNLQDDHETITKILICSPDIYYVKQRYVVFITLGFRGFKASPVDKSSSPLLLYVETDTLSRNSNLTSGNTSKITQVAAEGSRDVQRGPT